MAAKNASSVNGLPTGSRLKPGSWSEDPDREAKDAAHLAAMAQAPPGGAPMIEIPMVDIRFAQIKLVGDSGLIVHNWSHKAKKQILDKQMGRASKGKTLKNPEEDYRDSMYRFPGGGHGFPAIAFKDAAVSACTSLDKSITKVAARQAFHVVGSMVRIDGEPIQREDMVRVGMGTADIRFRAEYPEWSTTFQVRYNARAISDEQIFNLFNIAGFAVGVGEWRSEKGGSNGLFHVAVHGE